MKAIVTGATGMLAIATINCLTDMGYEVIAIVRPNSSRSENVPSNGKVTVISLDMASIGDLPDILISEGLDPDIKLFFHFAWDGTHGDSRNNLDIQTENIRTSIEAVRAAARLGCETFLGAGSQAEYGRVAGGTKLSGSTPVNPENGYGIGKLTAGLMTRIEAQKLGMRHIWVRILSVYGPFDGMHTMVMSGIGNMLEGKKASYTKGEQLWDYIYCKDAARAFVLAALKGEDGSVYPIGSGNVRPLRDYITDIRDAVDPEVDIGFGEVEYYPGQVMYLCADISKLTQDTGFVPEYTFERGIKETVEWYKEHYLK
ncbi:MAG: NAD(P)-dependent oxidoreductase [Saccharofermentans sp.]|nr:NAD(P)-dependent oxidoreductase [Saccharofermentans sp.]